MSDINTKLFDDLMGLREAARDALNLLQDEAWWEGARATLARYPDKGAYALVNRQEFADALNMLYGMLHPDSDDDEMQERVYAAVASAPDSDHREIARLRKELDLLALAINHALKLSKSFHHVECGHCGTRYSSDGSTRYPICPGCGQVARGWLWQMEIDAGRNT